MLTSMGICEVIEMLTSMGICEVTKLSAALIICEVIEISLKLTFQVITNLTSTFVRSHGRYEVIDILTPMNIGEDIEMFIAMHICQITEKLGTFDVIPKLTSMTIREVVQI